MSASQWCPGRVPAVFQWCPGSGVWQWCSGGVPVVFRWFSSGVAVRVPVVSRWCFSGVPVVLSGGVPVVFRWCFSGVQWCPGGGVPVVSRVAVVSRSYPNPVPLVSSMLVPGLWGGWCPVGEVVGGVVVVVGVVGCWSSGGGCGGVVLGGVLFGDVYSAFCVVVIGVSVVASPRLLSCHDVSKHLNGSLL